MPRRRRHSSSPSDLMLTEDDDDLLNQDDFSPQGSDRCPPQQRNAANARERARMRVLSKAFCRLKTTLPWVPADTKLSKLDTLRLASGYIAHLRTLLDQPLEEVQQSGRPLNLSWPFTFQQGISTPWISSAISPGRTSSPMSNHHSATRIMSADHQSSLHNHHAIQHHNNYNINNNNNSHNMNNENNNCDPGYHNSYFSRNGYYPQEDGSGSNNMNNYYSQIQRDNYMRHSYSESMLHSG